MFKKISALLLVVLMLFSFAACSGSAKDGANAAADALLSKKIEKKDILGTWESEAKIADVLSMTEETGQTGELDEASAAIMSVLTQIESDETFDILIKFNQDDTYDAIFEAESFIDAMFDFYGDVFKALRKDKELLKKFMNIDEDTLNSVISSNGFSSYTQVVDLLEENLKKMDRNEFISTLTSSVKGSELEDGNIVLKGLKYEISGKNLKIQLDKSSEETTDMILKNGRLTFKTFEGLAKNPNAVIFKNGFEREDD